MNPLYLPNLEWNSFYESTTFNFSYFDVEVFISMWKSLALITLSGKRNRMMRADSGASLIIFKWTNTHDQCSTVSWLFFSFRHVSHAPFCQASTASLLTLSDLPLILHSVAFQTTDFVCRIITGVFLFLWCSSSRCCLAPGLTDTNRADNHILTYTPSPEWRKSVEKALGACLRSDVIALVEEQHWTGDECQYRFLSGHVPERPSVLSRWSCCVVKLHAGLSSGWRSDLINIYSCQMN